MTYRASNHFKKRFEERVGVVLDKCILGYLSKILDNREYKIVKGDQRNYFNGTMCRIKFKGKWIYIGFDRKTRTLITAYCGEDL